MLNLLSDHLQPEATSKKTPKERKIQDDVWAIVEGDQYLDEKDITYRKGMRKFMEEWRPKLD
jgi:hypothetical protein